MEDIGRKAFTIKEDGTEVETPHEQLKRDDVMKIYEKNGEVYGMYLVRDGHDKTEDGTVAAIRLHVDPNTENIEVWDHAQLVKGWAEMWEGINDEI